MTNEPHNLNEGLKQARKNIGMDPDKPSCWKGYKAKGTKIKDGKEVPDCKKEEVSPVVLKLLDKHFATKGLQVIEGYEFNNIKLWEKAKSLAESKFAVFPSEEANTWATKWYKSKGGKWFSEGQEVSSEVILEMCGGTGGKKCSECGKKPCECETKDKKVEKVEESCGKTHDDKKKKKKKVEESAVPGKPAERLGAVTSISQEEQKAAKERLLAKTKAKREAAAKKSVREDVFSRLQEERMPSQNGNMYIVNFYWRGHYMYIKIFFPQPGKPSRTQVSDALNKIYPGARVTGFQITPTKSGESYLNAGSQEGGDYSTPFDPISVYAEFGEEVVDEGIGMTMARAIDKTNPPIGRPSVRKKVSTALKMREIKRNTEKNNQRSFTNKGAATTTAEEFVGESAAWTKKSGKNPSGGLNEKGRKSYEAENPGSDLKAPSKKVGNPRRASFCARMSGMKKKLTSKKTANDPDSRINKSLRAWNC